MQYGPAQVSPLVIVTLWMDWLVFGMMASTDFDQMQRQNTMASNNILIEQPLEANDKVLSMIDVTPRKGQRFYDDSD